jgi:hypothetical protein
MPDTRIILSGIWVSTMLIYLLGDVIRIFSGDVKRMGGMQDLTQGMWLGIAVLMLLPIAMVMLALTLPYPAVRWVNIVVAAFWFIFNLVGLPGYPGLYDKFLLAVSMLLNVITIWIAWKWV